MIITPFIVYPQKNLPFFSVRFECHTRDTYLEHIQLSDVWVCVYEIYGTPPPPQ